MLQKFLLCGFFIALTASSGFARDIQYKGSEVNVYVTPGEPTQINFQKKVESGFKGSGAGFNVEPNGRSIVVFPQEELSSTGGVIIVKLENDETFTLRVKPADNFNPRDNLVSISSTQASIVPESEELPPYLTKNFPQAPVNSVSGLMREMVLAVEFGKPSINGYRVNSEHRGETILDDGAILTTIDQIYIGPNYWGYVLNVKNQLDSMQQLNAATFRVDGTRAVMAERWELSPNPVDSEQQLAGKHLSKVYVVTVAQ